jgi:hypothetical protein
MVQNNQKTGFYSVFSRFWASPNRQEKVDNGFQVGRMYGPTFKLESKPLTKSLGPFFKEKCSKTTKKHVFYSIFGYTGSIWAPPHGPKKVDEGIQVSRMYNPMSKLRNKPLTKTLGPSF